LARATESVLSSSSSALLNLSLSEMVPSLKKSVKSRYDSVLVRDTRQQQRLGYAADGHFFDGLRRKLFVINLAHTKD
jgi:hypothetical protein